MCLDIFFLKMGTLLLNQSIAPGLCIIRMHTAVWESQKVPKKKDVGELHIIHEQL
jgi:hypothetical protein